MSTAKGLLKTGRCLPVFLIAAVSAVPACESAGPFEATPSETVEEQLRTAIDDEYRAEATYLRVLSDLGNVAPFSNIVNAEERHSTALGRLFIARRLDLPASQWNANNVPIFSTLISACAAGVEAELANIAMYDQLDSDNLPADVRLVFSNNRRASLERHLPAFRSCS